jgi:dTDP-4-amino-4,6-dideoxygalactose transaminase
MPKLAIQGGTPVRTKPFPRYNTIGAEEKEAVLKVLDSGVLSKYLGTWSADFYGGPVVQRFENDWASYFGVPYAIAVNSGTSGLYAAVGACGISPGDEVIVSPYTMTASAVAPIIWGSIPVFADIDPNTFCLDPDSIRKCITPQTKAIIVVDLFGYPADIPEIMAIAREYNLLVIEDAAQAPGAQRKGHYAGTQAHIGVFSLNYHKTIHTGEGGMIVTGDRDLAEKLQLIRNHAEAVVESKGASDLVNMIGFNFRMTEIEAAIGIEQLQKLNFLLWKRIHTAHYLTGRLRHLPYLRLPPVPEDMIHGYYAYPICCTGISRDWLAKALVAEGIPMVAGYAKPLYLQPMYQKQIAIGRDGFPFSHAKNKLNYELGACPVAERMYYKELMYTNVCHAGVTHKDLDDIADAFEKVLTSPACNVQS